MDFSRPASADPKKLLAAANDWKVTQAFASPAVWDKLSRYCDGGRGSIPTLRKVFSCGAPVPASVLERTLRMVHPEAKMHTPYGATEALPVATIEADEVLQETAVRTSEGAGVCVGRKFDTIDWRIIRITDDPIATIGDAKDLPAGEIGELIVRGPQVSTQYVVAPEHANRVSKIRDGGLVWHRMGDVGYLDDAGRFWYCGRKSQRVETSEGPLFTECVEPIFMQHNLINRTALVGVGPRPRQTPVIVFEPTPVDLSAFEDFEDREGRPISREDVIRGIPNELAALASGDSLGKVRHFLRRDNLPVDVRHNSKINREELAVWARTQLRATPEIVSARPLAAS
jgi:acyl-CoA synthetase (AMP-forming)/AMP-acid ligase II